MLFGTQRLSNCLVDKSHQNKDFFFASRTYRFKNMFFFSNCVYRFGKYLSHGVFAIGSNENSNALVTTRTSHLILIHLFASKHFILISIVVKCGNLNCQFSIDAIDLQPEWQEKLENELGFYD